MKNLIIITALQPPNIQIQELLGASRWENSMFYTLRVTTNKQKDCVHPNAVMNLFSVAHKMFTKSVQTIRKINNLIRKDLILLLKTPSNMLILVQIFNMQKKSRLPYLFIASSCTSIRQSSGGMTLKKLNRRKWGREKEVRKKERGIERERKREIERE